MVKVCKLDFPKGTFPDQKTDGLYMDGYIKENLDVMAKRISDDMQFVAIVSGKGTVRNGKSTFAQHQGYYFTHKVNEIHKLNNKFTVNNIVFKADELIEKAFTLPKYSVLVLDEGDDLTAQHYSQLAIKLRRFFRKCGQLNLFLILLIPDYFELPRMYAVTRSTYLVNVMFAADFRRGYFEFYSGEKKRALYYKGKRFGDYNCVHPNFKGRFPKPYVVDDEEYRKKKMADMMDDDGEQTNQIVRKTELVKLLKMLKTMAKNHNLKISQREYGEYLGVSTTALQDYLKRIEEHEEDAIEMDRLKKIQKVISPPAAH